MWSQIPSLGAAPQKGLRSPRCCPDPWGDLLAAVVLGTEACLHLPVSPPGWLSWPVVVGEAGGQLTSKTEPTPGESSPASRRCHFLLTGRLLSLLVRLLKAKRFTLPYKYHLPALNKTAAGPRGQA